MVRKTLASSIINLPFRQIRGKMKQINKDKQSNVTTENIIQVQLANRALNLLVNVFSKLFLQVTKPPSSLVAAFEFATLLSISILLVFQ